MNKHLPQRRTLLQAAGAAALLATMTDSIAAPAGLITRPIPRSGERLPAIGLGTYQVFDVAQWLTPHRCTAIPKPPPASSAAH